MHCEVNRGQHALMKVTVSKCRNWELWRWRVRWRDSDAAGILFGVILLLLASASATAQTNFTILTLRNGRVYSNAVLKSFTATDLTIVADDWNIKIPLSNCPSFLQKEVGYDPMIASNILVQQTKQAEAARPPPREPDLHDYFRFEYDKFNQATSVIQIAPAVQNGVTFEIYCVPTDNPISQIIFLNIISRSHEWRFLDYRNFTVLYDQQHRDYGEIEHKGDVRESGGVLEYMWIEMSVKEFAAYAWARKFECKLGSYEFELTDKDRFAWKILANALAKKAAENTNTLSLEPIKLMP